MESKIRLGLCIALAAALALPCSVGADQQPGEVALSPALAKLDKDDATLGKDTQQLAARAHKVSQMLDKSGKLLGVPAKLASDLGKLETMMKQLDSAVEVVEVIPQAREDAKRFRDSLAPVLKDVTAAKQEAQKLADRVAPVKKVVDKAAPKAEKLSQDLTAFDKEVLQNVPPAVRIGQSCVNKSLDAKKACMQGKLDGKAEELDKLLLEMDKVIKPLIASYVPTMPALSALGKFDVDIKLLDNLCQRMEHLEKRLAALQGPLSDLTKLLDSGFKVHFLKHSVEVKMRIIVQGADAIEKEIEHILSKEVWKIAKEFGIGKLVKSLQEDAQKELDKALKKLDLSALASLGAVKDLENFEAKLDDLLSGFPKDFSIPTFDAKLPNFGLPGVSVGINLSLISPDLKWISPNVFDLKSPSICTGVSYECK